MRIFKSYANPQYSSFALVVGILQSPRPKAKIELVLTGIDLKAQKHTVESENTSLSSFSSFNLHDACSVFIAAVSFQNKLMNAAIGNIAVS